MVKKGSELTAAITGTVFPNKGVAYVDGEKILVHDALQGQKVRIRITRKRRGKSKPKSWMCWRNPPLEQEPACAQFGLCGGCTYLNIAYENQLDIKAHHVLKLLADAGIKGLSSWASSPAPTLRPIETRWSTPW